MDQKVLLCLESIRKFEGGYSNDPTDRGGPTKLGITQITYNAYRRRKGLQPQPVSAITPEEEADIFYSEYYLPVRCNAMELGWALAVSDTCYLCGENETVEFLSTALRVVTITINSDLVAATIKRHDIADLDRFLDCRRAHHNAVAVKHPDQQKYLHGWLWRVDRLAAECYALPPFRVG